MTKESRIQAVEHVNIQAPAGLDDALRWFYGELAELDEVNDDSDGAIRLRFKSERIELRVHLVESPTIEAVDCRVTIAVPSLSDVSEELVQRRIEFERIRGLTSTNRRIQTLDPAGNRVEFKQEWRRETF